MSKFLRLAHDLINTRHIIMINIYKGEYHIKLDKSGLTSIQGITLFGAGVMLRDNTNIIIKEHLEPENYKIVTDWIKKNEDL